MADKSNDSNDKVDVTIIDPRMKRLLSELDRLIDEDHAQVAREVRSQERDRAWERGTLAGVAHDLGRSSAVKVVGGAVLGAAALATGQAARRAWANRAAADPVTYAADPVTYTDDGDVVDFSAPAGAAVH